MTLIERLKRSRIIPARKRDSLIDPDDRGHCRTCKYRLALAKDFPCATCRKWTSKGLENKNWVSAEYGKH
jgi:hypothetical protein